MSQYPNGPEQPYQPQQPGYPPPGYQQPPMQPQQPQKKKPGIFKIGCGVLVGLVVLIAIISVATGGGKSSSPTTTPSSPGNAASSQAAPSKPQSWQTTHTYSGNGSKKTESFTVGNDWKIQWSCTPGSFDGIDYNVIVSVTNADNTPLDPGAINTTCKSGNASGETEEHQGGTVFLDITSEGDWSFTVLELK